MYNSVGTFLFHEQRLLLDNYRVVHQTHIPTKGVEICCYINCELFCTCCGDYPAILEPWNVTCWGVATISHTGKSGVLIVMKSLFARLNGNCSWLCESGSIMCIITSEMNPITTTLIFVCSLCFRVKQPFLNL